MILGKSVFLRTFDLKHVAIRTKWMNDPEVREYLNSPFPVSEISTQNWLSNMLNDSSKLDFIICLQENERPIGYTGFRNIDLKNQKAESYTGIGEKEFWGYGYAKESKILALRYIFKTYNLNRIYAVVRSDHEISLNLNKSIGYKIDGILRQDVYSKGEFRDMTIMSILAKEFHQLYHHGQE